MSLYVVIRCDGTWASGRDQMPCTGKYPVQSVDVLSAVKQAVTAGWLQHQGGHLCPAHVRALEPVPEAPLVKTDPAERWAAEAAHVREKGFIRYGESASDGGDRWP